MSTHLPWVLAAIVLWMGAAKAALPVAPDKFIPTYVIAYGSPALVRPAAETAKFDLLIASFSQEYARV